MKNPRNKLLEASTAELIKPAGQSYTVDALASDLGCSKKTIYKHFRSKEELMCAVLLTYQKIVERRFQRIGMEQSNEVDILMKYIYAIDKSIRDIRMSRWYKHSKDSNRMQEHYFGLRLSIYERYLMKALFSFEQNFLSRGKNTVDVMNYVISTLEHFYVNSTLDALQNAKSKTFVDTLIFVLHGCLISLESD